MSVNDINAIFVVVVVHVALSSVIHRKIRIYSRVRPVNDARTHTNNALTNMLYTPVAYRRKALAIANA